MLMGGNKMKRVATIAILLVFLTSAYSFAKKAESNKDTLIALLVIREDLIKKCVGEEILLIGKYSGGKYGVVSYWDEKKEEMVSSRKNFFNTYKDFIVYRKGIAIKKITIKEIRTAAFDCSEITVGSGKSISLVKNLKDFQSNLTTEASGFSDGKDFSYKTTYYLAINADSPAIRTQQYSAPIVGNVSGNNKNAIYKYAQQELIKNNKLLKPQDIIIPTLLAYNLNMDKKKDYVVVAKAENNETKESGVFVVNIMDGKVVPLLVMELTNDPDSWGNGYELVDVFDVDGDKKPEIIVEVKGYEATGYGIYKFKNNKFIKVFDDVIYGC